MPSKINKLEGAFRKLYGRHKADMILGRISRSKSLLIYQRMKDANKI